MPWRETCPVDERHRFIREHQRLDVSMSELCRDFGISRKTGYKWLQRFDARGREGLTDGSHAADAHPNATDPRVAEYVATLRRRHPTWGPKKLRSWLAKRAPAEPWPAPSTIGEILRRRGLSKPQQRVRRTPPWTAPLTHATEPNAVWSIDFKGWFRTGDGERCDPLTMSDAFSRYVLCSDVVAHPDEAHVRPRMERVFREYGLPEAMRSDNGQPFASTAVGGLSRLSVWWVRLGIRPERIEPGKPEQNGRHERMHRTLKAETAAPPAGNATAQQRTFDGFRATFNEERPHEALNMETPASVYRPSPRHFPERLPELVYPDSFELRRVRTDGTIKCSSEFLYVSEALTNEVVGLEPLDERYWRLRFGPIHLGYVDVWRAKRVTHVEV
jgi:transposase InsO family protein